MVNPFTFGRASTTSMVEFNERVKQLLKDKPDPKKAANRRQSWASNSSRPVKRVT